MDEIKIAKSVIDAEIEGLRALATTLGEPFRDAVVAIADASGRVIVTGMGKSGHIARKIAATFASTGTPAHFVHPAEASHGDLGMIAQGDVIIALSKSGETPELNDMLGYAARFSIPVIAITESVASTLSRAATIALILPPVAEASGETRAPTTSTTMMAALGDALAVTLLRRRGFTSKDFRGFHPGGQLGASLRRVSDLMRPMRELPLVKEGAPLQSSIDAISRGGFGCVGVVDNDGRLIGIVTDGDLRRHLSPGLFDQRTSDIMTRNPRIADPNALAGDVLAAMSREKITALFVVKNDKPIGIVHVHDCLTTGVI